MPKKTFPQIVSLPVIKVNRLCDTPQRSIGMDNILLEPLSTSPYRKKISTSEIKINNETRPVDKKPPIYISSSSSDDEGDNEINDNVNHQLKGKFI